MTTCSQGIEIFEGDDVHFIGTVKNEQGALVPLGGATTLEFIFNKAGTPWVVNGSMVGDGSTAQMEYNAVGTEIDTVGDWFRQCRVIVNGKEYHSEIVYFEVKSKLPRV